MEDIPLCRPTLGDEEKNAISDVLYSGWLAHGPKNEEFEEKFSEFVGVENAISMNSCTSALQLAIKCLDITGEVILPSFTFVASANAVVNAGATPVFVDIRRETRNIDTESLKEAISQDTEAIMPVHFGGLPCNMSAIMDIASSNDLVVIEDSAETIGGQFEGRMAGTFGIGCFSFYPTKNITTGEGGMLTTSDSSLAEKVRAHVGHGIESTTLDREDAQNPWYRAASHAGYNYRMSNIHAAIGVKQMDRIKSLNEARRQNSRYLTRELEGINNISPPVEPNERHHVYQMYTILTGDDIDRSSFVRSLNERGIGASVHFSPPVHKQPHYESGEFRTVDLSTTERVANNIVSLPMYPKLSRDQLDRIANAVENEARGS